MTVLKYDAVSAALAKIVAEKGEDYLYPGRAEAYDGNGEGCYYAQDEEGVFVPSCLIGHVIAELDPVGFELVAEYEATTRTFAASQIEHFVPGIRWGSYKLECAVGEAQAAQDTGATWGEALQRFQQTYERG